MKQEGNSSFIVVVVVKYCYGLVELLPLSHFKKSVLHINVECIVTVQQMVECITLHMGSANNCYSKGVF